ncbi:hypothetical protein FEM48_Zijuj07G0085800 [Ziziphus jujuba var. spinosa]|uniref:Uncharacterized protein n=1 Tax=Ziziphus jujuba var. spinosa TaxID=714518 RepID=A0A978V3L1_ZIZJJ|nr:hypothetical protein FEM48_Zijuj07G0085800 [Ziziphus jujuba var. spinosa]
MERSHLKSPIEDSRRFEVFGNRQWLCGENLMENTVVLLLTDQSEGTIETPTQKKHFGLWTFKTLCIHTEYSSSFWCQGHSIQLDHVVLLTMEFDDREIFQWSKVTTSINNLILEKLYYDHCGTMRIQGNHNYSCKLKFKEQSIIDQIPHQRSKPPQFPTRYNLPRFAITMNELTLGLKEKLSPIDLRLRPDQSLRVSWLLGNQKYYLGKLEKHMWMQRGWGLSRKSSYGEYYFG